MALLEVNHLNISFGGLHAVDDFHVSIEKGQLYGLIGPNGAGKTTIFNLLTGVYKPDEGIIISFCCIKYAVCIFQQSGFIHIYRRIQCHLKCTVIRIYKSTHSLHPTIKKQLHVIKIFNKIMIA